MYLSPTIGNNAQGIRGMACFLVVIAHGFQGFGMPETSFDVPFPFALPFFRLILHGGFLAVAIFFVLSGYVCSMKPLKLARAGKSEEARKVIGSSAFRRVIRLVLPVTLATTISWYLAQVGAYNMAHSLPEYCWLNFHSAWASDDWATAIEDLFKAFVEVFLAVLMVVTHMDV
jgi:peptidoglycan/LPS O-acetylase OafA/YrhL